MTSFKENWPYYWRRLTIILLLLAFVLGFHGLYSYYAPIIARPWQLFSAMLYGMMKLFLFSPPLSAEANVTWTYELAKWMAPLLTSALVLTALSSTVRHILNHLSNRFGRHMIIFGHNEPTKALMDNLRNSKPSYKVSLVNHTPLTQEVQSQLESKGIAVYTANLVKDVRKENLAFSKGIGLDTAHAIVIAETNDLQNYDLLVKLLSMLNPRQPISVHVRLSSKSLQGYIVDLLLNSMRTAPHLAHLNLHFFNENSLAVELILRDHTIFENNLKGLDALTDQPETLTVEIIDQALGTPHIVLIGLNDTTDHFIRQAANDLVINLKENPVLSIVGQQAEDWADKLLAKHSSLGSCVTLMSHTTDVDGQAFNQVLSSIASQLPPVSAVCLLEPVALANLEILQRVQRYLPQAKIFLRNNTGMNLQPILDASPDAFIPFGDLKQLMTPEIVLQEKLDEAAITFNAAYNRISQATGSGRGSSWAQLSPVKKGSSRASARHALVKQAILNRYFDQHGKAPALQTMLLDGFESLKETSLYKESEVFRTRLLEYLDRTPLINFLTQLEHKRWSNHYYAMGYLHGPVKDEKRLTHPCLIDDWETIRNEAFFTCHPEYDLISVFSLIKKEQIAAEQRTNQQ